MEFHNLLDLKMTHHLDLYFDDLQCYSMLMAKTTSHCVQTTCNASGIPPFAGYKQDDSQWRSKSKCSPYKCSPLLMLTSGFVGFFSFCWYFLGFFTRFTYPACTPFGCLWQPPTTSWQRPVPFAPYPDHGIGLGIDRSHALEVKGLRRPDDWLHDGESIWTHISKG